MAGKESRPQALTITKASCIPASAGARMIFAGARMAGARMAEARTTPADAKKHRMQLLHFLRLTLHGKKVEF